MNWIYALTQPNARFRLISDFSTTIPLFVPCNQYFNKFYWLRGNILLVILSIADTADNNRQCKPLCENIRIFVRWICKIWMFSVLNEIDLYAFFIRIACIPWIVPTQQLRIRRCENECMNRILGFINIQYYLEWYFPLCIRFPFECIKYESHNDFIIYLKRRTEKTYCLLLATGCRFSFMPFMM